MKKLIKLFILQTTICLLFAATSFAQVNITLTPPADTTGACESNVYALSFSNANGARIVIDASLLLNGSPLNCSGTSVTPIFLNLISNSANITNVVTYNNGSTMSFSVNNNSAATISYNAFIDCSIVPAPGQQTTNIDFVQAFDDSSTVTNYSITINNTASSSFTAANVQRPILLMANANANQYAHYETPSYFYFYYANTGNTAAHIKFNFLKDASEYCSNISTDSIHFAIGKNGNYNIYQPNSTATINVGDTLVIRQKVHTQTCIDVAAASTCGLKQAVFDWRCNNTFPQSTTTFCDDCPGNLVNQYQVYNGDAPIIKIERITPSDSLYDFSCMNDVSPFVDWEFRITNSGVGAMDSLNFTLSQNIQNIGGLNYLSLVPASSFIYSNTGQCSLTVDTTHRTQWLCQTLVPHALHDARFRIKVFGENDTIVIKFKSFKCSEENSVLFNTPKYFSRWAFYGLEGKTICQTTNIAKDLHISTGNSSALSTHPSSGSLDLAQNTQFQPTVTDLSVPQGTTFGDSALMSVRLRGLFGNAYDYQVFGCAANNSCNLNGWFRATVFCDTNLRIQTPRNHARLVYYRISQGDTLVLNPNFISYTVDTLLCDPGFYHFYFNMNTTGFRAFLDSANFEFTMQSCCLRDKGKSPYRISFYTLPNPLNCFTLTPGANDATAPTISDPNQQWLPLNFEEDEIAVHCPGCRAPGIIADRYRIERQSFGLRDTDNDSRADNGLPKIIKGDSYYNQFKNNLNTNISGYGDTIVDFLAAHFQDGATPGGGYTYQQMITAGVPLHYLQLSRIIPTGLDTMNLTIDSVVLYIDTILTNNGSGCIDCQPYGVLSTRFVTQRIVRFNSAAAYANCVIANPSLNQFLFTFCDTVGGNIDAHQTFNHATYPFVSFQAEQRYRLYVRYRACGNYRLRKNYSVAEIITQSQIFNEMWMTGKRQTTAQVPLMPNDTSAMHSMQPTGYTITGNSCCTPVDSGFINNVLFRCETMGGRHYFVPNSFFNTSTVANSSGCEKLINVKWHSDIAGYRNRHFDVFPYEYRPPALFADTITVEVPAGYFISRMRISSSLFYFPNGNYTAPSSAWRTIPVTGMPTGTVNIPVSSLPAFTCLPQDSTPGSPDSTLYWGDQFTSVNLECYITPATCTSTIVNPPISTVILSSAPFTPNCLTPSGCSLAQTPSDSIPSVQNIQPLVVQPNLNAQFTQTIIQAQQPHICWNVTINNPQITIQQNPLVRSTAADNLYIGVPLNGAVPALANWNFTPNGGSIINATNGIIPVSLSLAANASISGQLCASLINCNNSITSFNMYYGWNCNNYPVISQIPNNVCGVDSATLQFNFEPAQLVHNGKSYETPYTLCDTVTIHTCFKSTQNGYAFPTQATLTNLAMGLNVVKVRLVNLTTGHFSILSGTSPVWQITQANMAAVDFPLGGLNANNELCIYFDIIPECDYAGNTILPDIFIEGTSYCGALLSTNATYNNNGTFTYGSTQCTDCWSITKTISTDTVVSQTGTVTYSIEVCNNSATTQTATVTDNPPNGFVQTSLPLFPLNVSLASMQCSTLTVTGYFTTPANCIYNVASVKSPANTTWKDSVCVTVLNACSNTDTTFRDSTFSGSGTVTNKSIYVEGRYYVNNTLNLNGCTVYTNAAAQIIVQSTGVLNLNNTTIQSCDTMWQGVTVDRGKVNMTNSSVIKDAHIGLNALDGSTINITTGSKFLNCVTGYFIPPKTVGLNSIISTVSNATFAMTANTFKPDYIGQPAHGKIPRAGIEVFSTPGFTIGGNVSTLNTFDKLNNGVIAHNSTVTIKNSKFTNIAIDTIYIEPYHGAAMVGVKDEGVLSVPVPKLTVLPENGTFNTVDNCFRAIYTDGSVLNTSFVHLLNVQQGIFGTRTPTQQTSMVNNCTITTATSGIFWTNNAYAKYMFATANNITVNASAPPTNASKGFGRGAIYMSETHTAKPVLYKADYNIITLNNAFYGIAQVLTNKGLIKHNIIQINGSNLAFSTGGIVLSGTQRVNASCNNVLGYYPQFGLANKTYSIYASLSERSYIGCNTVDSTINGIYFGGFNPVTRLKGNSINRHFDGLYLNNVAVIDSQAHGGNLWNGPFTNNGALNTAPLNLVLQSPFLVDQSAYNVTNELLPSSVVPSGWFSFFPGYTFLCSGTTLCNTPPPHEQTSEELAELIASGEYQTEDYIAESRAIAEEYLYGELRDDSALWVNDSVYAAFIAANEEGAIGELYEVEFNIEQAMELDSVFNALIASIDSQTVVLEDSITSIDALAEAGYPIPDYDLVRGQLVNSIAFLAQTRQNILSQQEANRDNRLQDAELINDIVVPDELPQTNSQIMNDVEIEFEESGGNLDVIRNHYTSILPISLQCPYAGGQAVDKARVYLAMLDPSTVYNDDDICLQSGFYRVANDSAKNVPATKPVVQIIPNPANNKITIELKGITEGICKVKIENSLAQVLIKEVFDCKKLEHEINTSKLVQGIYSVKIDFDSEKSKIVKLVIVK